MHIHHRARHAISTCERSHHSRALVALVANRCIRERPRLCRTTSDTVDLDEPKATHSQIVLVDTELHRDARDFVAASTSRIPLLLDRVRIRMMRDE